MGFLNAKYFVHVLKEVRSKYNIVSSLVSAILSDLTKLNCLKLLYRWMDLYRSETELMTDYNPQLKYLFNHYKQMRREAITTTPSDSYTSKAKKTPVDKVRPVSQGLEVDPLDDRYKNTLFNFGEMPRIGGEQVM